MRTLLLEPFSGISGDMFLGTLVDLGVPLELMREQVAALGLEDRVELTARTVRRASLAATKVDVIVDGQVEQPSPGGAGHEQGGAGHEHGHDGGSAATATPDLIREILEQAGLDTAVRTTAGEVFERLAAAEARVHGAADGHVHLHEVGALDAIVDVVCAIAGVRELAPERVIATPPRDGHGEIHAAHGVLPVPAPATLVLLEGIEIERIDVPGELVTPTGAALLVTLTDEITRTFSLQPERIGYGAGTRQLPGRPNLLRGTVGESPRSSGLPRDEVVVLETTVDDSSGEYWPWVIERLRAAGARDAWMTPVMMKKGRPGIELTAIVEPGRTDEIARLILTETSTLGLRVRRTERMIAQRAAGRLDTRFGHLPVKLSRLCDGEAWQVHPEFEVCREVALKEGVPLRQVYDEIVRAQSSGAVLEVEDDDS